MFTFNPNFFNSLILLEYSSGCKIFPGSETKSFVKLTPFSIASKLFFNFLSTLVDETTFKLIIPEFFFDKYLSK